MGEGDLKWENGEKGKRRKRRVEDAAKEERERGKHQFVCFD